MKRGSWGVRWGSSLIITQIPPLFRSIIRIPRSKSVEMTNDEYKKVPIAQTLRGLHIHKPNFKLNKTHNQTNRECKRKWIKKIYSLCDGLKIFWGRGVLCSSAESIWRICCFVLAYHIPVAHSSNSSSLNNRHNSSRVHWSKGIIVLIVGLKKITHVR